MNKVGVLESLQLSEVPLASGNCKTHKQQISSKIDPLQKKTLKKGYVQFKIKF